MSIFHDANSLRKRYLSGLSYNNSTVFVIKSAVVLGAFSIFAYIGFSVYDFDNQNKETFTTKQAFKKSQDYDMYAEKLKYQDSKNKKVLHSKKVSVDNENNKTFDDVLVESKDDDAVITAKTASVKNKSSKYFVKGDVKYKTDDLTITSDEGVYDNDAGKIKLKGNFKIVINDKDEDKE